MIKFKRPKYGNSRVVYNGITFDSKREMQRYIVLSQAQENGLISNLRLQPKFELLPPIKEQYVKHLKTKDKICERVLQKAITYKADFAYTKNGAEIVEDVKPCKSLLPKEFTLKAKLMRYFHGISVRLVFNPSDEI